MIEINIDNNSQILMNKRKILMQCKKGYVHNFAWFEVQSKKMCINCGIEDRE